jgi:hypothetical protein
MDLLEIGEFYALRVNDVPVIANDVEEIARHAG